MKRLLVLLSLIMTSCYVEDVTYGGPPETSGDVNIVSPGNEPQVSILGGQTWVITKYRVGDYGEISNRSDTLKFINNSQYKFNGLQSTYSLYQTGNSNGITYNLTLNGTVWGNINGTVNHTNITLGDMPATEFRDISAGSSNTTKRFLWLNKLQ